MAKKKEMCSLENHEPGAGIVLMKLEELHSFEGHPFKVERNQELFELRCSIAKDILPTYYDANKINYVSQGIFRIHLVGLSFNNGNWMYICTTLKIWTLATVVLYPLAGIIIINCFNIALWDILNKIFLIMILGGMVVSIYIIGKKYE